MNVSQFKSLLEGLDEHSWQALLQGQSLIVIDDESLALEGRLHEKAIVPPQLDKVMEPSSLREFVLLHADEYLNEYYRLNPLSPKGFNRQVQTLVEQYGADAFAAEYPDVPQRTLFVEVGDVIAEDSSSPRHRYGAYCELEQPLSGKQLEAFVQQWIDSNQAYERYISMNVCRYSCVS